MDASDPCCSCGHIRHRVNRVYYIIGVRDRDRIQHATGYLWNVSPGCRPLATRCVRVLKCACFKVCMLKKPLSLNNDHKEVSFQMPHKSGICL